MQQWGKMRTGTVSRRFTDNGFAKPSRRWVGHEKRNTWAFVLSPSFSLPLRRSVLPASPDPSPASSTYRIAPSPPALDTEPGVRKPALAEEGWLCTNSPTWDAHFRTLSSSTLLARAALHLVEHLRTRSHPSEGSIARSWRVTSGSRSKIRSRPPHDRWK